MIVAVSAQALVSSSLADIQKRSFKVQQYTQSSTQVGSVEEEFFAIFAMDGGTSDDALKFLDDEFNKNRSKFPYPEFMASAREIGVYNN